MKFDPALQKSLTANRAAIDAAREHEPCGDPCPDCDLQRWLDARDDEFDARWNARVNP